MFVGPFDHSIIKRAREKNLIQLEFINIRDFGEGKHKTVDDTDYGGGVGMVMRVDILHKAILHTKQANPGMKKRKTILLSASGSVFSQKVAYSYSQLDHLILLCGHYEGVDERILNFIDEEISIGDFILTGGEIPAMVIVDAVARLGKDVLKPEATMNESFSLFLSKEGERQNMKVLDYPHYTKPSTYMDYSVPDVLLRGDHKQISKWREEKANEKTARIRPDLARKD